MGWQTSKPSVVSSWASFANNTTSANNYHVDISVKWARMADTGIAVEFTQNTSKGSYTYYKPPDYMDYSVTVTGTTTHSEDWGTGGGERYYVTSKTIYWTGTINDVQSMTVKVGGHNGSGAKFSHATYIETKKAAPPYVSTYTLSFNGNGSTGGSTGAITKAYSTTISLPANGFTKTNYYFVGWNTNSSGTGTTYQPGTPYTITANTTLYAMWQIGTYNVTYKANGGTGSDVTDTVNMGQAATIKDDTTFSRDSYSLDHWNTAEDDSGTSYSFGDSYSANTDLTLFAIWRKNNIPLYVNVDGNIHQVVKAFANVNNTIKECRVFANVGGQIKELK